MYVQEPWESGKVCFVQAHSQARQLAFMGFSWTPATQAARGNSK